MGQNPKFSLSIFTLIWFAQSIINEVSLAGLFDQLMNKLAKLIEYTGLQANNVEYICIMHTQICVLDVIADRYEDQFLRSFLPTSKDRERKEKRKRKVREFNQIKMIYIQMYKI